MTAPQNPRGWGRWYEHILLPGPQTLRQQWMHKVFPCSSILIKSFNVSSDITFLIICGSMYPLPTETALEMGPANLGYDPVLGSSLSRLLLQFCCKMLLSSPFFLHNLLSVPGSEDPKSRCQSLAVPLQKGRSGFPSVLPAHRPLILFRKHVHPPFHSFSPPPPAFFYCFAPAFNKKITWL